MGVRLNPLSGNFDFTGGGGGASYIDGEVAIYNDLPLDGTAALNSAWLVRSSSGIWPFNKPAGIYYRSATAGVSRDADYSYGGTLGDVFSDSVFLLYDEASTTRTGQFNLGNITAGQNRILTWPNAPGTIARTEDFAAPPAIGSTTPAAGTFTTLTANNGTLTASAPVLDLAQTWNNAAATFTGVRFNIINTASATASLALDFQVGGSAAFQILRSGIGRFGSTDIGGYRVGSNNGGFTVSASNGTGWVFNNSDNSITTQTCSLMEQRSGTTAQTFNIYNTYSSVTNFERGFLKWSSNVFQIGTEKGSGGGTARALELQTDGVTRMTIGATGESTFASGGAVVITNTTASSNDTTGALRVSGGIATLGDINARSAVRALNLQLYNTNSTVVWQARSVILSSPANGVIDQSSTTTPQAFRLFKTVSGAGGVNFERANLRWDGDEFIIDAAAGGTGTLRGIKIGSATSSLLGFYGVTPVDQPATVADPAGGGTVDTEARTAVNAIIDRLQELGLIA